MGSTSGRRKTQAEMGDLTGIGKGVQNKGKKNILGEREDENGGGDDS